MCHFLGNYGPNYYLQDGVNEACSKGFFSWSVRMGLEGAQYSPFGILSLNGVSQAFCLIVRVACSALLKP